MVQLLLEMHKLMSLVLGNGSSFPTRWREGNRWLQRVIRDANSSKSYRRKPIRSRTRLFGADWSHRRNEAYWLWIQFSRGASNCSKLGVHGLANILGEFVYQPVSERHKGSMSACGWEFACKLKSLMQDVNFLNPFVDFVRHECMDELSTAKWSSKMDGMALSGKNHLSECLWKDSFVSGWQQLPNMQSYFQTDNTCIRYNC